MNERRRRNRIDRVTTRSGDAGETSLADGRRYPKHHSKIELAGALDEANTFMGALAEETDASVTRSLRALQARLFDLGAVVATGHSEIDWHSLAANVDQDTAKLNTDLKPLREFILPGGGRAAAAAHVARAAVRRAERAWWAAADESSELAATGAGVFLNRLSDHLFVLARTLADDEVVWEPLQHQAPDVSEKPT